MIDDLGPADGAQHSVPGIDELPNLLRRGLAPQVADHGTGIEDGHRLGDHEAHRPWQRGQAPLPGVGQPGREEPPPAVVLEAGWNFSLTLTRGQGFRL